MIPLTGKRVKNPKKSAIIDHILLKGHDASLILLKVNNKFKLHLKESLLIKRDKPKLNRNINSYPLELSDCFHNLYFVVHLMLPMREGSETYFDQSKYDFVEKNFLCRFLL